MERARCPFPEGHAVHIVGLEIWIEQLRPIRRDAPKYGWNHGQVGTHRRFDPTTGFISSVIRFEGDNSDRRPGPVTAA
jgi:hypothetical protein